MSNIRQKCLICPKWGVRFKKEGYFQKGMVTVGAEDYSKESLAKILSYKSERALMQKVFENSNLPLDLESLDAMVLDKAVVGFLFGWELDNGVLKLMGKNDVIIEQGDLRAPPETRSSTYRDMAELVGFSARKKYKNGPELLDPFYIAKRPYADLIKDTIFARETKDPSGPRKKAIIPAQVITETGFHLYTNEHP